MSGDLFSAARRRDPPATAPAASPAAAPATGSGPVEYRCAICGEEASFGFDVFLRRGQEGRWACLAHRDEVEAFVE